MLNKGDKGEGEAKGRDGWIIVQESSTSQPSGHTHTGTHKA